MNTPSKNTLRTPSHAPQNAASPASPGERVEPHLTVLKTHGPEDYELLDSGAGRKLERFGAVVIDRPEKQAIWSQRLSPNDWRTAHAVFSASSEEDEKGSWRMVQAVPDSWPVQLGSATVACRLKGLWHVGVFPEQYVHWQWVMERLAHIRETGRIPRVLNLFGYTGAASLLAAAAGAEVTHVDASKAAVNWARENQEISELSHAKIRWIVDDAAKFTAREVRRERRYDLILVDPPKFGRGPNREVWDLFDDLPGLLSDCRSLACDTAALVLTVYAIRASAWSFAQLVQETFADAHGAFEAGELMLAPRNGEHHLPTSLFVRWSS